MASFGDNIGNLFGLVIGSLALAILLGFMLGGWKPWTQSGGRKIMKGGDWTDYFHWTGWGNSDQTGQYTSLYGVLVIFGLLFSLAFILPLVEKGVGGGGKA
jgi:TRAP-type C4-dicarboxylate transport system permease small subunit